MRAVIFLGSPKADTDELSGFVKDDDFVICADKGYKYAKRLGVHINAVLGDFDSCDIKDVDFKGVKVFPSEKDFTDCEIAVDYACEKGADEIVLLCATGGREDHFLGNIYALRRGADRGVFCYIYTKTTQIYVADDYFETTGEKGDILSVFEFFCAKKFTTENLKYALKDKDLPYTCISNVFSDKKVSLKFSGRALIIHTKEDTESV